MEVKADERMDSDRLHFNHVAPLFEGKYSVEKILALNINETKVLKLENHSCLNPMLASFPMDQGKAA